MSARRQECPTFAPATIAPAVHPNVEHNPNPNPNPNLNTYPTPNLKPNHHPHSNSLLSEISSQEQLSPAQMLDHQRQLKPYFNGEGGGGIKFDPSVQNLPLFRDRHILQCAFPLLFFCLAHLLRLHVHVSSWKSVKSVQTCTPKGQAE